VTSYQVRLIL